MRKQRTEWVATADKYLISVHPDGRIRKEGITKAPDYKKLNEIVGGYIELIPYFTRYGDQPCVAFCNEYGKLPHYNLPYNAPAMKLWAQALGHPVIGDHLVGTIAIIVGPQSFLASL